jgi:hypothetical protein
MLDIALFDIAEPDLLSDDELAMFPLGAADGLLLSLERGGILSPTRREIVIERLLALDTEELSLEQVKWVVLMVLSSQPASEAGDALTGIWRRDTPMMVPRDDLTGTVSRLRVR